LLGSALLYLFVPMANGSLLAGLPTEFSWNFSQVFGERAEAQISEADIISAVEFNHDGDFLATGDKGGRVVLFERSKKPSASSSSEYEFYTEFQSHEPEFDYLKSLEIEEKINQIRWLKPKHDSHHLLTSNDKTIKLWKVFNKSFSLETGLNLADQTDEPYLNMSSVRIPKSTKLESRTEAKLKRVFANAHAYHINSISLNSDDETFLSADDLRINLWNLEISDQSFNIVDMKPAVMEELSEVITCAQCHPINCNLFIYSSSKGNVRLGDMRQSALCDQYSKSELIV